VGQTVSHCYASLPQREDIVGKGMSILLILVVLTAVSVKAGLAQQPVQPKVVPLKKVSNLSMDKRYETVSGTPRKQACPL
jgi:hypothetical protein